MKVRDFFLTHNLLINDNKINCGRKHDIQIKAGNWEPKNKNEFEELVLLSRIV